VTADRDDMRTGPMSPAERAEHGRRWVAQLHAVLAGSTADDGGDEEEGGK
jgi:hypothetical protein